ncbi:hypothetical protein QE152_g27321 [Popillia japonica]|uniref:Uncharacterized protein n=1 Tax=Popillia japonica TaxID=7064 RepID=A0AAW1JV27_POPJA
MKEIRSEQKQYFEEIGEIKKENIELRKKVNELENKLEKMGEIEQKIEKIEKDRRRKNIIIKGKNIIIKGAEFKDKIEMEEVQKFIENKIGVKSEVKEVEKIGDGKNIRVTLENLDQELKIQKTLRVIAKNEKEKGKRIKLGFQKIIMDGNTMIWDKNKNDLVENKKIQAPKN